jgi:hypothetical protein
MTKECVSNKREESCRSLPLEEVNFLSINNCNHKRRQIQSNTNKMGGGGGEGHGHGHGHGHDFPKPPYPRRVWTPTGGWWYVNSFSTSGFLSLITSTFSKNSLFNALN